MAEQSIKQNYVYNTIFQLFSLLAPVITMPYVSRVLQADFIGFYSYANSIATYFALFAALGISAYGAREVSISRNDRTLCSHTFWELTIIRAITTALCLIAYLIAVAINGENIASYLAFGAMILSVAFDFTWFLQAMEDFRTLMVRNFIIKALSVVCIFLFVRKPGDLTLYIFIQTASALLANLLTIPRVCKYLSPIDRRSINLIQHFRQIFVYFIPVIASSIYTVLDRTMLGVLARDNLENAYYELGHKIINLLLTIITSLNVIVGMRITYLYGQGKDESIKKYIRKSFQFMSLISMPMIFGLVGCARNFVPLFFGEGYDKVAPVIMLFSPIVFIIGISNIIGSLYLTPSGQRARANQVILIGAAVNFVLNLILIPIFKSYGAVVSSLAAEGIIALMYIRLMREYLTIWDIFKAAIKYVAVASCMLAAVVVIGRNWHTPAALITQVLVGAVIYIAGLFITRDEIVFAELSKLKQKFSKKDS
ncbi:MAG: flippase [Oscillospiraceae bacterium]|nr:flippase [Oscillospiraceae bacterium]